LIFVLFFILVHLATSSENDEGKCCDTRIDQESENSI